MKILRRRVGVWLRWKAITRDAPDYARASKNHAKTQIESPICFFNSKPKGTLWVNGHPIPDLDTIIKVRYSTMVYIRASSAVLYSWKVTAWQIWNPSHVLLCLGEPALCSLEFGMHPYSSTILGRDRLYRLYGQRCHQWEQYFCIIL